jgi:hypothetical protein
VLVCGGGIAGIQASLDLSAAGFRVYLVEESPTIGGSMARLDKTFPTGDCATCIISPKLVECMRDYNVDVLTMADVTALEGEAGHFVRVRKRPKRESREMHRPRRLLDPVRWQHAQTPGSAERAAQPVRCRQANEILARHEGSLGRMMPVLQESARAAACPQRLGAFGCAMGLRLPDPRLPVSTIALIWALGRHVVEVCSELPATRADPRSCCATKEIGVASARLTSRGDSLCEPSAVSAFVPCRRR